MKSWNFLPTISASMPFQLALDEILFRKTEGESVNAPFFRFYYSSEPWITVGYSYRNGVSEDGRSGALHAVTPSRRHDSVPQCRRITGGGSAHHGEDILFSLVARKEDDESFPSVRMSYLKIHEAVKMGLEKLGTRPRFYRCDEKLPKGEDCFRFPIATDLALGKEKIAGGGQKRSCGVLLHQESLRKIQPIDHEKFMSSICHGLEKTFQIELKKMELNTALLSQAEELAKKKYPPLPVS